ncbi:MAG: 2-hydroxyacyl-CoA dehydratase [Lachnospiraceae bacterium]|nr:2-hydroxyacyl-CoA dehydratase [Lachnospiraceae bacterium]
MKRLGLDIGSTTVKAVVLDENDNILFSAYERHMSLIAEKAAEYLQNISDKFDGEEMQVVISGSAGMGLADYLGVSFAQEVFSTRAAVQKYHPGTDAVIELGGEDAKILFLTGGFEARMNGSCAGGTGAFIDQMATLIGVEPNELNELAKDADRIYTIASRCGVFAKSDIQPLLNQGASFSNISASIFKAVVNQTIGGLAQGREIKGNVLYLGGPLSFFGILRKSFDEALRLTGKCPDNSLYFVALGAAMQCTGDAVSLASLSEKALKFAGTSSYVTARPLFANKKEYNEFVKRHKENSAGLHHIKNPKGKMFLGIDAGSTTIKLVAINEDGDILDTYYAGNQGNPVPLVKNCIKELYDKYPGLSFSSSAVTGYGEELIKAAFSVDYGLVETMAHFTAAKKFRPDVDFIIDIGGQDIKCFKIHNNAIDNIFLNEACSSGCGSFLQTFAKALGRDIESFAKLGLFADRPVELGSRCTVFMNSSVKQAQKDGASIENISAGLSMSVVKNALYKVIRCGNADELGKNIVVQGGTFLNDAVLRAFELEIGREVIRPSIAGMMGAYGAALYAVEKYKKKSAEAAGAEIKSTLLTPGELEAFNHKVSITYCKGCSNHCQLTINFFGEGKRYIAGNRCEKPLAKKTDEKKYNLYEYKLRLLSKYRKNNYDPEKKTVGLPLALNMYELLPFWYTLFKNLDFNVFVSPDSNRELYLTGQHTIPSDTVCFPAKLLHGHIEKLLWLKPDIIFYPCMSYNVDEHKGDNHYNCPVVAYYPEVAKANIKALENVEYIHDFVGIHNTKTFPAKFAKILAEHGIKRSKKEVGYAMELAFREYYGFMNAVRKRGEKYAEIAKKEGRNIIVLAGRPYHIDPETNHGIDRLICDLGAVVITEDSVSCKEEGFRTTVLNQWTYHSRLYLAAKYVAERKNSEKMNLVQLVSFGCGVDAITSDEVRGILESNGKIYTQIKIDEVTNTGAARIRLRSLFAAVEE